MHIRIKAYNATYVDTRLTAMWVIFEDLKSVGPYIYATAVSSHIHKSKSELDVVKSDRSVFFKVGPCTSE